MTETDFLTRAGATLDELEAAVEALDTEAIDVEASRADNVLTFELADGSKIVINTQAPTQQIWVAAKSGGFHYAWRDGTWRDTRDGSELFAALSRLLSQQSGQPVMLKRR